MPTRVLVNTKFLDRRGMDYHSAARQTMRISDPGEAPPGPWDGDLRLDGSAVESSHG